MDRDSYQVEVLHYLNPHLIWVEVVETGREFVFEQIGIYGILPFETTIDDGGQALEARRCEDWVGASTLLMKKSFSEAQEVWFGPTHIDRRTSIFDDNTHKYGEIILITNNKQVELSKILINSGFALNHICLFHQELSLGNLKTKLTYTKTQEIVKHLEKDTRKSSKKQRELSVSKQTTVFQAAKNLESTLTERNLKRHDINFLTKKVDNVLQRKSKDFDRCKDIDEESIGRGNCSKTSKINEQNPIRDANVTKETKKISLLLKKKLELSKQKPSSKDPLQILIATKQYLEANAKIKKEANFQLNSLIQDEEVPEQCSVKSAKSPLHKENGAVYESKRPIKKSKNVLEYDKASEKLVMYGPPDINPTLLPVRKVPIAAKEDEEKESVSNVDTTYEEPEKNPDPYADEDSSVDIKITNKAVLKETISALNKSQDSMNNDSIKNDSLNDSNCTNESTTRYATTKLAAMQKKLKLLKDKQARKSEGSMTSSNTTNKDSSTSDDVIKSKKSYLDSDDDEDKSDLAEKMKTLYPPKSFECKIEKPTVKTIDVKNNVNPFKNLDPSISVFVDKLVTPVLMVHNKMNYAIQPSSNIRDINFNSHIHIVLKNLGVEHPMMLQMISWPVILRGFSLFMIDPLNSGKTMGYLPAVCRLITDDSKLEFVDSRGPTCIIVCATARSVCEVEHFARMFLGLDEKVVSCYAGVDDLQITTALLNGCDLFVCTPSVLVRLLHRTDFSIDLRRLATFVLDDCERLSEVYLSEVKYFLMKIREMLKKRANKELLVQFIVASRIWCDFMEPLAKKSPNSVICIGAFQECVLYSKANTTVDFLKKENKTKKVLEFLNDVDGKKKTVIVCRSNEEVDELSKVLTKNKYVVFACDNTMTVEELYNLSKSWIDYQEPLLGPILVCCDSNLNHLNVTDAHHLVNYSLPPLFSMFCKRFSVLNDNYSSIFKEDNESVKIKVLLEDGNVKQLPKLLNFIKRCTNNVPEFLDKVCEDSLHKKDLLKAQKHVPICDSVLAFGECPEYWNCQERHSVFKEHDEPKTWMPKKGVVTFKILHCHSPILYSVRLLSNTSKGNTLKYPQTYSTLSLKLGMYYSKEVNRKLHGTPIVGDVCAVSVKQNFFVRCQVLKVLTRYNNGTPNCVLVKMVDEEKLEKTRDVYLYHLPEELKNIETHIVQLRLANVCPKDKDITFSDLAKDSITKITANNEDLYHFRGHIVLTIGNCIFVDTLEACQELTALNDTVVMHNIKKELLSTHAIANPEHIVKMGQLCKDLSVDVSSHISEEVTQPAPVKYKHEKAKPQWAHLENDTVSSVYFASAENPGTFFVRLVKFEACMKLLLKDIEKYMEGEPKPLEKVTIGEIVISKFPDDSLFERARVDDILNENMVKCFFVDQGDWRDVNKKDLVKIPTKFITQIPFQAIECRLIGVQPVGDGWTEFGTNWFYDNCFDANGDPKVLYVKYFTKENSDHTNGHKYGVALIDTNSEQDVIINQLMIDLNLAKENDNEIQHLQEPHITNRRDTEEKTENESSEEDALDELPETTVAANSKSLVALTPMREESPKVPFENVFLKQPIRSVPLVDSDNESADSWDIGNPNDLVSILKGITSMNIDHKNSTNTYKPDTVTNQNKTQNMNHSKIQEVITDYSTSKQNDAGKIFSPLDSDDLSSADGSQNIESTPEKSTALKSPIAPVNFNKRDDLRKPKLLWRQNKTSVSVKILLIGTEDFRIHLQGDRILKFDAFCNDIKYGFDIELYGVVDKMVYSDKGQYILINLNKVIKKNWLTLTKDGAIRKWIVYDVDAIDTSSDEDEEVMNVVPDMVKYIRENERESDSDEDFLDDVELS